MQKRNEKERGFLFFFVGETTEASHNKKKALVMEIN